MDEKKGFAPEKGHEKEDDPRRYGTFGDMSDDVELQKMKKTGELGSPNPAFQADSTFDIPAASKDDNIDTSPTPLPPVDSPNAFTKFVERCQNAASNVWESYKSVFWMTFYAVLIIGYAVYFGLAMHYEFGSEPSVRLLWVTCVVLFFFGIYLVTKYFGETIAESCSSCTKFMEVHNHAISWVAVFLIYIAVIVFVIVDVTHISKTPYNLVSGAGLLVYILLFFIFSYSPAHVNWRAVCWGLGLQFLLALVILRWDKGYQAFEWLGDRVTEFLDHTDAGSIFVFGEKYTDHYFAFKVLPVVVFFSTAVSVLYYLGAMQVVIEKIAWIMQYTMGTTAAESLNAAGNIFIGQSEAPLMIRPFIKDMTRSEIHAVMTGGFATIAGSVLAAYILFGVPANHLLSASVMSAPAALAMSKLFYPETEESKTTMKHVKAMEKPKERNIIEAASSGASQSVKLVANIAANLIAFIAALAFLNATLTWFGNRVGIEELTFELICSYVLFPFALMMGVDLDDCRRVAKLIGIKTFLNEFVAYDHLSTYIKNRKDFTYHVAHNGAWYYDDNDIVLVGTDVVLEDGILTDRSEVIATYALCGFANFGSIGVMLGALGALAPERKQDISSVAFRAMLAGNVACFMTACIAEPRSTMIATFALCGFANFSSMGVMIGALGAMAPTRKSDLAKVALRAMIAGNVACFMTACIAGLLYQGE